MANTITTGTSGRSCPDRLLFNTCAVCYSVRLAKGRFAAHFNWHHLMQSKKEFSSSLIPSVTLVASLRICPHILLLYLLRSLLTEHGPNLACVSRAVFLFQRQPLTHNCVRACICCIMGRGTKSLGRVWVFLGSVSLIATKPELS